MIILVDDPDEGATVRRMLHVAHRLGMDSIDPMAPIIVVRHEASRPSAAATPTFDDEPVLPALLTFDDVAAQLRKSRSSVKRLAAEGALPVVRVGRSVRIRATDFMAYVDGLQRNESPRP